MLGRNWQLLHDPAQHPRSELAACGEDCVCWKRVGATEARAAAAAAEEQLRGKLADAEARAAELRAAAAAVDGAEERVAALLAQHTAMQQCVIFTEDAGEYYGSCCVANYQTRGVALAARGLKRLFYRDAQCLLSAVHLHSCISKQ